jgi:release factor glutamine methyltransferase
MATIASTLRRLQADLDSVAGQTSLFEAETLLQHVLGCTRSTLYLNAPLSVTAGQFSRINEIVKRRLDHEPLAYILETVHFYTSDIIVSPVALIPRPETEILVETVLKNEPGESIRFLDVGTGSGAIALSLQKERPHWRGIGIDISLPALKLAKRNCPIQTAIVCCDCVSAFKSQKVEIIVSNPPYVSEDEMKRLDPDVKMFEPPIALFGGKDGLNFYRILSLEAKRILEGKGRIYFEISCLHAKGTKDIFISENWDDVQVLEDLTNRPRVLTARLH